MQLQAVTGDFSSDDSESEDTGSSDDDNEPITKCTLTCNVPEMLKKCSFKWFAVVDVMTRRLGCDNHQVENFFHDAVTSELSDEEKRLLEQSHDAYLSTVEEQHLADRQVDCI